MFPHFSFKNQGKKSKRDRNLYNFWSTNPLFPSHIINLCPNQAIHNETLQIKVSVASIQKETFERIVTIKLKN